MKFNITKAAAETFKTDMMVIGLYERADDDEEGVRKHALIKHVDGGIALDRALKGELAPRLLFTAGRIPARFVLLIGMGKRDVCTLDSLREVGTTIARQAAEIGATNAALVLERGSVDELSAPARGRAIAEGILLGAYQFTQYKTNKPAKPEFATTTFLYSGEVPPLKAAIEDGRVIATAQNAARDLINTPAIDATPRHLARHAKTLAAKWGLKCKILSEAEIRREKMGGLLAVSQGSAEPPCFIVLTYKPREKANGHVAFVGKGITFDSGGISLKPPRGMELMKEDMAGAAAVLEAMAAIAQLKPRVQVSAYIPVAENMPDGRAIRPGDVIRMRNGKTVEIISTDAEGRLILADALSYAADEKPDAILELATLTGGAAYCCGELYTLAMGNDQKLVDRLRRAAEASGEPMWQLPIVEQYKKGYTSGIADLNNSGKSKAQTILGAIFLREFVNKIPWVHLDIAASSWSDEELPTGPRGATGCMVRTLTMFAQNFKRTSAD